jgi:hypothetical protein
VYPSARVIAGYADGWLSTWGFPVHSLTVAYDKACRHTDVFLDDSPDHDDALVACGHPRPVLWGHPCTVGHPAERVDSWPAFHTIVDEVAASIPPSAGVEADQRR